MRTTAFTVALLLTATGAHAQQQQFDLICKGEEQLGLSAKPGPATIRYRVDLATSRWCKDDCAQPRKIQEVTPDRILLFSEKETPPLFQTILQTISRIDGSVTDTAISRSGYLRKFNGKCEAGPFSGMPSAMF